MFREIGTHASVPKSREIEAAYLSGDHQFTVQRVLRVEVVVVVKDTFKFRFLSVTENDSNLLISLSPISMPSLLCSFSSLYPTATRSDNLTFEGA